MPRGLGAKGLRRRDGSLDLEDEVLEELDLVVVSIHSRFDLPREDQTARVLAALEHPAVDVLGHPFGRLIGKRRPMAMNLDDSACRAAVERGVGLVISTDAHSTAELGFMRWGVEQARRGWVERADVANARPLGDLRKRLRRARGG